MDLNLECKVHVVSNSKDGIADKMGTLGYDGSSVVVGHDMFWTNHDIVSCSDDLASGETDSILLDDLFD